MNKETYKKQKDKTLELQKEYLSNLAKTQAPLYKLATEIICLCSDRDLKNEGIRISTTRHVCNRIERFMEVE